MKQDSDLKKDLGNIIVGLPRSTESKTAEEGSMSP